MNELIKIINEFKHHGYSLKDIDKTLIDNASNKHFEELNIKDFTIGDVIDILKEEKSYWEG